MNPAFHTIDNVIFAAYLLLIVGLGIWISHRKKNKDKTVDDYFLAGKSLPWWTIGASLIAANISAEQFIGMSGSGFAGGFAVASYEFMAALTLLIVAKFFMPVFVKQGIYTIPQFIEKRYSSQLKTILAVFWLGLFIFVNLTSVLFLGAKAIDTIIGTGDGSLIIYAIFGLGIIAALYSLTGGLSSVAWTDILQVVLLILGGLITTVFALQVISPDGTIMHGLRHLGEAASDRMHLVLPQSDPEFHNMPGIAMLIGGLWVANLYYWGFNQYIIQRAFAAKSLPEAQKGLVFAAFLKLLIPFIVVIPGIVAYVMYTEGNLDAIAALTKANGALNNDNAYPWLISSFIPIGLKGLVLAALAAAIISSLASMLNSASTIFTMDIFKPYIAPKMQERKGKEVNLVRVGQFSAAIFLIIACLIAPLLGSVGQMFQYIQEYTGLVSPGILAIFLLGLFWKKTTNNGAVIGVLCSIPIALALKLLPINMPFIDQMFYTCIITMALIILLSLARCKNDDDVRAIHLTSEVFRTDHTFKILAYTVCILLVVIYAVFW